MVITLTNQTLEKLFAWQKKNPIIPDEPMLNDMKIIMNSVKGNTVEPSIGVPIYKYFTKMGDEFKLKYTDDLETTFGILKTKSFISAEYNCGIPVFVISKK